MDPPPAFFISGTAYFVPRNVHDEAPPVRVRGVGHCVAADPGVVHQDVQPAESRHRGLDAVSPLLLASHVHSCEHSLPARLAYRRLQRLAFLLRDVRYDDLGTLPGEQARLLGAHALSRATYDGYLPFQSHAILL